MNIDVSRQFPCDVNFNETIKKRPHVDMWAFDASVLEQAECLEGQHPCEHRDAGERARVDDAVAGEFGVAVHLLSHGESGYGARRCEDAEDRDELDAAEAEENGEADHDGRDDDEFCRDGDHELTQVMMERAGFKRRAEDDERERRGCGCDLLDRFEERRRDFDARDEEDGTEECALDHRVFKDAEDDVRDVERTAAECFEDDDGDDVVERYDDRDHHGRDGDHVVTECVHDQRDAHEDEVAAEHRLDHGAAATVVFFDRAGEDRGDEDDAEQAESAEEHEPRPERRFDVCGVDVVEHHEEEEDAERHAVDMIEFDFVEEPRFFDVYADEHLQKHRQNGPDGDDKVAGHETFLPYIVA